MTWKHFPHYEPFVQRHSLWDFYSEAEISSFWWKCRHMLHIICDFDNFRCHCVATDDNFIKMTISPFSISIPNAVLTPPEWDQSSIAELWRYKLETHTWPPGVVFLYINKEKVKQPLFLKYQMTHIWCEYTDIFSENSYSNTSRLFI